jgi:cell division GTPase FtsZ
MYEAISEMSLRVNPKDAGRAIYLVTAPAKEMNMDMMRELNEWMRELCPNAIIRNGDYPRGTSRISVNVILSELSDVEKVRNFYSDSIDLIPVIKQRQVELRNKLDDIDDMSKDIPSLLEE